MADLRKQQGTAARALEFLILTTSRTAEAIGARWGEFNIGKALWTVPAERVKSERTHRVPLSSPALKGVNAMQQARNTDSDGGCVQPSPLPQLSTSVLLPLPTQGNAGVTQWHVTLCYPARATASNIPYFPAHYQQFGRQNGRESDVALGYSLLFVMMGS